MSSKSWAGTREAFAQSAAWFVRTCVEVHGKWDQFGLGEWTVRDLVGHTSRALLTVETYLDQETAAVEVTSPVEYFHLVLSSTGDPAAVAQRGRDAGAALGSDAAEAVAGIADRVLARVSAAEGTALSTPFGGMRLINYLPTRTFELTVHTCDLAAALGQVVEVPETSAVESLNLLGELAVRTGRAAPCSWRRPGEAVCPPGSRSCSG